MRQFFLLFLLLFMMVAGCKPGTGPLQGKVMDADTLQTNSNAQIANGIVVHEKGGLEVDKAFLSDGEGRLLHAGNLTRAGEAVYLNLNIKEGWMATKGAVSIGATQTVATKTGEPVLSTPDLFARLPSTAAANADWLRLKMVITRTQADTQRFVVRYRVWDKAGKGEVAGRYELLVQNAATQ